MKPLLTARKSTGFALLQPAHFHADGNPLSPGGDTDAAGPSVDVIKEGDKVVRLVVTCACGEKIEVECLYTAGR